MSYQPTHSLLPLTPDTLRGFHQEIVVDLAALMRSATKQSLLKQLPRLNQEGRDVSYLAAFEALRLFRHLMQEKAHCYSEAEKTELAEFEVEWCLDILNRMEK